MCAGRAFDELAVVARRVRPSEALASLLRRARLEEVRSGR